MELRLMDDEAATLLRALTSYLSDLRMEIAGTESFDFRAALKQDEVNLKAIIARLQDAGIAAA